MNKYHATITFIKDTDTFTETFFGNMEMRLKSKGVSDKAVDILRQCMFVDICVSVTVQDNGKTITIKKVTM